MSSSHLQVKKWTTHLFKSTNLSEQKSHFFYIQDEQHLFILLTQIWHKSNISNSSKNKNKFVSSSHPQQSASEQLTHWKENFPKDWLYTPSV